MIEINNLTKSPVNKKLLKRVAEIVLKGENVKEGNLSIVLVGENRIKDLNKKYRKKNKTTNVLSFNLSDKFFSSLGEIVICPQVIKKNAKKYKIGYNKELIRVLIHGVLHILGYEHQKARSKAQKMEIKEKYYNNKI